MVMLMRYASFYAMCSLLCHFASTPAAEVLVEVESFDEPGGWVLDTQFIDNMGSPYLLAHGMGRPVADASQTIEFPQLGKYRVFVRTKDWVARWAALGTPGRFQVVINEIGRAHV